MVNFEQSEFRKFRPRHHFWVFVIGGDIWSPVASTFRKKTFRDSLFSGSFHGFQNGLDMGQVIIIQLEPKPSVDQWSDWSEWSEWIKPQDSPSAWQNMAKFRHLGYFCKFGNILIVCLITFWQNLGQLLVTLLCNRPILACIQKKNVLMAIPSSLPPYPPMRRIFRFQAQYNTGPKSQWYYAVSKHNRTKNL